MTTPAPAQTEAKPPKPKAASSSSISTSSSRQRRLQQSNSHSSGSHLDEESRRLKSQYSAPLASLQELFPDWKDEDLLSVLAETDGNVEAAVLRITEGKF